ncbi:hypothetical protein Anas_13380 [Armadillidium nasatum]|uniref:Ionotropic glutamate receptor C-terminal domain-containing protein n=1 Tax=Armadillidium nasatum TaxID=96803 RepID=A0A5N5SM22_9CRUS|nr:hypothetical protein Anas_13380 [Armadillidium nasatum]
MLSSFFLWGINALAIKYNCPHRKYSLRAAFWKIFAATEKEPFLSSGKLVMVTSSLCSLILYTCYSAMLVSILTTMQPTLPFSNFEDLRKLPDWQLGTVSNSALTDLLEFPKSLKPISKIAFRDHKYAYLEAWESIEYLLQQMPLEKAMYIVNTGFDCSTIMPSLGIQKNSPFKEILNY